LGAAAGFTAEEGLRLSQALGALQLERADELAAVAREGAREMKARLKQRRSGNPGDGDGDEQISQLLALPATVKVTTTSNSRSVARG
jgi:hypothetical protein